MNYLKLLLVVVCCIFIFNSCRENIKTAIGETTREFADNSRSNWIGTGSRPLRVIIWYPSNSTGNNESDGSMDMVKLIDEELSDEADKFPLILLSPGSGQKAEQMDWLGNYLSLNGYVTVSINHNGTDEEERKTDQMTLTDFCIWERPQDLSAVLDEMLKDSVFESRIDRNRIGAAGFSLGGATAIWSAGARLNMDSMHVNAPKPPDHLLDDINKFLELSEKDSIIKKSYKSNGNSFKDEKIKAVFVLAPAVGYGFTKEGLSYVDVPVKIVVGDKDIIAPAEINAKRYADFIKNSELVILPGELGHYTKPLPNEQKDNELSEVSRMALDFFNNEL